MKKIAIITARGGSKRIPRKNIKLFCGKPVIAYSIEAALSEGLFDEVMVSTDDHEIAQIAKQYGAKVPFMRSEKNADDFAGTVDVILEVLNDYKNVGQVFTHVCCVYPTAPFITSQTLNESLELLIQKRYDSVFAVAPFSFPIFRALQIDEHQKASMIWPENLTKRSQDLPLAYHDAGQFYWMTTESLWVNQKLYTDNTGVIILDDLHVQDIDSETDWKLAELKYQLSLSM